MTEAEMLHWVAVGAAAEMSFNPGCGVMVGDLEIAVFEVDGGFAAVDGACPHAGGPLCEGDVEDGKVLCPWHGWGFELSTGHCSISPEASVRSYPVRQRDDGVLEVGMPTSN